MEIVSRNAIDVARIPMRNTRSKYRYGSIFLSVPIVLEVLSIFIVYHQKTTGIIYTYCEFSFLLIGTLAICTESWVSSSVKHLMVIPIAYALFFAAYIVQLHSVTVILD